MKKSIMLDINDGDTIREILEETVMGNWKAAKTRPKQFNALLTGLASMCASLIGSVADDEEELAEASAKLSMAIAVKSKEIFDYGKAMDEKEGHTIH